MSAPNMRERIRFDLQSQAVDAAGNITTTWTTVATVWAAVTRKAAREAWVAGRAEGIRTFEFVARWRSDIGTNHRVFWRGRRFDIDGAQNDDGQRQFMTIFATERDADADNGAPDAIGVTPPIFGPAYEAWLSSLPVYSGSGLPPVAAGEWYNNGGIPLQAQ